MADPFSHSVSAWLQGLKEGENEAAGKLWERYFEQLVGVARRKLGSANRRVSDEEDLAASVFHALCQGSAAGRFEKLQNRDDLWSLLVAITSKKAVDQIRRQTTAKRGDGEVRGHSVFFASGEDADRAGFEQVIASSPTPEFLTSMEEENDRLLGLLRDESQREIVRYRLAGYSNEEIAEKMGISLRSIERKLKLIREAWSEELE